MKITLADGDSIEIEGEGGTLAIEATPGRSYSPFDMLASALGTCTFSVLNSWAAQAKLDPSRLKIRIEWKQHPETHRVQSIAMNIEWPGLPQERRSAVIRAATLCSIHRTLTVPPEIAIEIENREGSSSS